MGMTAHGKAMTRWRLPLIAVAVAVAGVAYAYLTEADEFLPGLLSGALVTIEITALGAIVAVVAALVAALGKMYAPWPLRGIAVAYIETFRGTSALVQLFWLFFVLPDFGITLEPMTAAVLGLGLNVGAYGSEVVRGAIQAVPPGQWEAATALNMSRAVALRRIILPQAFLAMIPPWGNLLIELLKATALVSLITITDLAFYARQMNEITLRTVEIFTLTMAVYLCISLLITSGVRVLERWAATGLARGRAA